MQCSCTCTSSRATGYLSALRWSSSDAAPSYHYYGTTFYLPRHGSQVEGGREGDGLHSQRPQRERRREGALFDHRTYHTSLPARVVTRRAGKKTRCGPRG